MAVGGIVASMSDQTQSPIPPTGFLFVLQWWRLAVLGLGLALLGAVGAVLYVGLVSLGTKLVWGDSSISPDLFSGSIIILVIMTAAGLVVGIIHRLIPESAAGDVFGGLATGRLPTEPVPGGLLVSLVSLIGGFSLGPEVPTGMLAGGMATAIADRFDWDETTRRLTFGSAIAGAYGGLFTSPYVAILLILELVPLRRLMYVSLLGIEVAAALAGFAVFFFIGGFANIISELSLPTYELEVWHIFAGIGIGAIGAVGGFFTGFSRSMFQALTARHFIKRPVTRSVVAGALLGLLAMAVPLTLFSGAGTLPEATSQVVGLSVVVLVVSALAKIVAMTAAQSFGFIGGPIFPLVFAGGAIGAALNGVFPGIPLGLAVVAGMAAVPAAVLPLPLSLGILMIVIAGTSIELAAPVLTASMTASLTTQGLKRTPGAKKPVATPVP
jgi:H+/Cl- antiporter ClcA